MFAIETFLEILGIMALNASWGIMVWILRTLIKKVISEGYIFTLYFVLWCKPFRFILDGPGRFVFCPILQRGSQCIAPVALHFPCLDIWHIKYNMYPQHYSCYEPHAYFNLVTMAPQWMDVHAPPKLCIYPWVNASGRAHIMRQLIWKHEHKYVSQWSNIKSITSLYLNFLPFLQLKVYILHDSEHNIYRISVIQYSCFLYAWCMHISTLPIHNMYTILSPTYSKYNSRIWKHASPFRIKAKLLRWCQIREMFPALWNTL